MGMLVDGCWTEQDAHMQNGRYKRPQGAYRSALEPDVVDRLREQPGRYGLIASLSCPWSHRTLIMRALKKLDDCVPLQIAGGRRREGYAMNGGKPWRVPGTTTCICHLHQLYTLGEPGYTGRATVPVLWDSEACRIISNESDDIMRALDATHVNGMAAFTFTPPRLRAAIATLNRHLYDTLFNAVYRAGLAQRQAEYEVAVELVFDTLDELNRRLSKQRYLFGEVITDTDWKLFATLARFDVVYHGHFKCARRRLVDYPALWAYARDLHAWRGIAATVDFTAIREGYYGNDTSINPSGIVAVPPAENWVAPHARETLGAARVTLVDGGDIKVDPTTFNPAVRAVS